MPKLAGKCDTICTPASTVAAKCEALVFCCVATSKKNEMGTWRIGGGGEKKENYSGTQCNSLPPLQP